VVETSLFDGQPLPTVLGVYSLLHRYSFIPFARFRSASWLLFTLRRSGSGTQTAHGRD
jgi:hypothetical protein